MSGFNTPTPPRPRAVSHPRHHHARSEGVRVIHKWLHAAELGVTLLVLVIIAAGALALLWSGIQLAAQWATWGIQW